MGKRLVIKDVDFSNSAIIEEKERMYAFGLSSSELRDISQGTSLQTDGVIIFGESNNNRDKLYNDIVGIKIKAGTSGVVKLYKVSKDYVTEITEVASINVSGTEEQVIEFEKIQVPTNYYLGVKNTTAGVVKFSLSDTSGKANFDYNSGGTVNHFTNGAVNFDVLVEYNK